MAGSADVVSKPEAAGLLAQLFGPGSEVFGGLAEATDPPVHWPALSPAEAALEWRSLYAWVVLLQHRFREMVRLPACWYRHNGLVETLSALRDHERASYADTAPPTSAIAWHAALRDTEARLRGWITDLRCGGDINYHDPVVHAATRPDLDAPADFAEWIDDDHQVRQRAAVEHAVADR